MSPVRYLERAGRPRLAYRYDAAMGECRAAVLLTHGYAEHGGRYDHVVGAWAKQGIAVGRVDLRGHGLSDGERGHIGDVADYVDDLRDVLSALSSEAQFASVRRPILFGHSLGGLVSTHAAFSFRDRIAGLALSSPFFGVARRISVLEIGAAVVLGKLTPTMRRASGLAGADLTHDREIAARYEADPLHFDFITTGWYGAITRAQDDAQARAPELRVPVYGIAAGDDKVVKLEDTKRFFARVGSAEKELDVRPALYHEILNEPEWPELASMFSERMLRWARE
ncbi:MAG TPA: alpha/beta hydrolase [Polyangiaceae bacterium]|jgi:lysophospholipase|nr:alpha/beta hydrolase [Polyangiaceae bacterium]